MRSRIWIVVCVVAFLCAVATGPAVADTVRLRLATTTSTLDSGLLDALLPVFEKECGCKVDVIAVGTGKALKLGENGDVDLVMVHAPSKEEAFVKAGFGVNRRGFMENDFIVLGPEADPAGIAGIKDAAKAFIGIAAKASPFVSRGDNSGTHTKEMIIWKAAGIEPSGDWYMEIGQGMGAALTIANEKSAYVLSDRGTYLARKANLALKILVEGDPRLLNPYSVIAVNPARHPKVNSALADRFIQWVCGPEAQKLIGEFKVGGELLFRPTAGK